MTVKEKVDVIAKVLSPEEARKRWLREHHPEDFLPKKNNTKKKDKHQQQKVQKPLLPNKK
jgi:hypothetical protein